MSGRPRRPNPRPDLLRPLALAAITGLCPALAFAQLGRPAEKPDGVEPRDVREAARDVLARPEFRGLPRLDLGPNGKKTEPDSKPKPEQKPPARVSSPPAGSGLLAELFGAGASLTVVLVLALLIGAIVALIVLGLRNWERGEKDPAEPGRDAATDDEPEPAVAPGDRPADAWLAAARAAAAAGRFDEALSLLLLGAMGHAERAGLIRPRRGLTYRDYLRAVPDSSAWHPALDRLIRAYAPVGFGRRPATAAAYEAAVAPYEHALALEPPLPAGAPP